MAHPQVGFTLTTGERTGLRFPREAAGPRRPSAAGSGASWGASSSTMRLPSTARARACAVSGFAGLPTLHRPDTGQQYLFVNGRPVKDKLLIGAVRAAYGDLLPARAPSAAGAVRRRCRPREVDVNVHPSKAEVRFRDAGRVRALVGGRAQRQRSTPPAIAPRPRGGAATPRSVQARDAPCPSSVAAGTRLLFAINAARPLQFGFAEADAGARSKASSARAPSPARMRAPAPRRYRRTLLDRPLGAARAQLHETYIVAQTRTSDRDRRPARRARAPRLRAHEGDARQRRRGAPGPADPRDRRARGRRGRSPRRPRRRACRAGSRRSRPSGRARSMVREVPALLGDTDVKGLVRDLAREAWQATGERAAPARRSGWPRCARRMACHGSVRAGRRLDARGDERAPARYGGDALFRPVQPRPPHLRGAGACRHRAPVRPAIARRAYSAALSFTFAIASSTLGRSMEKIVSGVMTPYSI